MEPEEIEQKEFSNSLRGYDRAEVDSFAAQVAQEIRDYKRRLEAAQRSARDAIAKVEEAALEKPPPVPVVTERSSLYQEIGHETARILEAAEQVAADIKNRASSQSAEILADAHRDSALIAQEAKAGRRELEEELRRLKQTRAMLAAELEDVRRRITESVSRLQVPIEQSRPRQAASSPPAGSTVPPAPAAQPAPPPARDHAAAPIEAAPLGKGAPAQSSSGQVAPAQPGPSPGPVQPGSSPATPPVQPGPSPAAAQPAALQEAPVQPGPHPAVPADSEPPQATPQRPTPEETPPASRMDPSRQNDVLPPDGPARPSDKPAAAGHDRTNGNSNGNGHQVKVEDDVVERLLREIREEGEASGAAVANPQPRAPRRETLRAQTPPRIDSPSPPEEGKAAPIVAQPASEAQRTKALGTGPADASRRLKRLLQEDQNDLLHRLRLQRGKGTVEDNIYSEQDQFDRFNESLFEVLASAFAKGRKAGGGKGGPDAGARIHSLLSKQVVNPLRSELVKVIEAGLTAGDTPTAIADRASDVYRVWKGVRTEMLGEGIVYAAFNLGLLEAWASNRTATKLWVVSPEETQCPGEVCKRNAAGGAVAVGEPFESGHLSPPAHGGCTCSLAAE